MLDVLACADRTVIDRISRPGPDLRLGRALTVAPSDETEFVCIGITLDHCGRRRRCGWHLVLHRVPDGGPDPVWTHLYRVLPEHGDRVLVLLHRAEPGDRREALRRHAVTMALAAVK